MVIKIAKHLLPLLQQRARDSASRPRPQPPHLRPGAITNVARVEVTETPIIEKQLVPDQHNLINFMDGKIRYRFHLKPHLKYSAELMSGQVYFRRFSDRLELAIKDEGGEKVIDSVGINGSGTLTNKETKTAIYVTDGRRLRLFGSATVYANLAWVFPEATTIVKTISLPAKRSQPIITFGGKSFLLPEDRRMLFFAAIEKEALYFEANRYGIYIYHRLNGTREFVGHLRFDNHGNLLHQGEVWQSNGEPINIFSGKRKAIPIHPFIPYFSIKDLPIHTYGKKGRADLVASIKHRNVRFQISARRRSEYYDHLVTEHLCLRVGQANQIDLVAKDAQAEHLIGVITFRDDGTILGADGKPFQQNGKVLRLDNGESPLPGVAIEDLIPEAHSVVAQIPLTVYGQRNDEKASFKVNRVFYRFPVDTRGIFRPALEQGRLYYRHRGRQIALLVVTKNRLRSIGRIDLNAEGYPLNPDGSPYFSQEHLATAKHLRAALAELVPRTGTIRVPMVPREIVRKNRPSTTLFFAAKHQAIEWFINMTNSDLIYQADILAGRVFFEADREEIRVTKRTASGKLIVLGRCAAGGHSFTNPSQPRLSLAENFPALGFRDKAAAARHYQREAERYERAQDFAQALEELYKARDLFPGNGEILGTIKSLEGLRQLASLASQDLRQNLTPEHIELVLASGVSMIRQYLSHRPYYWLAQLFMIAANPEKPRLVRGNAIYMISEMAEIISKDAAQMSPRERRTKIRTIREELVNLLGPRHVINRLRDLLVLAVEKCDLALAQERTWPS